jgi:hypothetical protein
MMRAAVLALLLALAQAAQAATPLAPPSPPARYALQPVGEGTLTWFGLHVYDAALWAPNARVDFDSPLALVVRYARALEGAAIAERALEEIAQLGIGSAAQRAAWGARLRALLPDVDDGDLVAGVHRPGQGMRFYLNGRRIGEINDPAFSRAFLAIWLDPRTSVPALRAALIGER